MEPTNAHSLLCKILHRFTNMFRCRGIIIRATHTMNIGMLLYTIHIRSCTVCGYVTSVLCVLSIDAGNENILHKREKHTARRIREKLQKKEAAIALADEGKTIVIIHKTDYNDKINQFLTENDFHVIPKNPTDKYQKQITHSAT
jgi:hypothetical protein